MIRMEWIMNLRIFGKYLFAAFFLFLLLGFVKATGETTLSSTLSLNPEALATTPKASDDRSLFPNLNSGSKRSYRGREKPTEIYAAQTYGPDTCLQKYVWREAFPGDHVCVPPESRAQAADDKRKAKSRVQRGGGPYGPDTCQQGYVWREARPNDHVCVTPATRAQTARENSLAVSRRASSPSGSQCRRPEECRQKAAELRRKAAALNEEKASKEAELTRRQQARAEKRQREDEECLRKTGRRCDRLYSSIDDTRDLTDAIRALESEQRETEARAAKLEAQAQELER